MKNFLFGVDFNLINGVSSSHLVRATAEIIAGALLNEASFPKAIE